MAIVQTWLAATHCLAGSSQFFYVICKSTLLQRSHQLGVMTDKSTSIWYSIVQNLNSKDAYVVPQAGGCISHLSTGESWAINPSSGSKIKREE
jgi:hypothetical protein